MMQPQDYPKRVLLVVSGMSPQILTETVYALANSAEPFLPTEIHMVTTQEGAQHARLNLLHPISGQYYRLCAEYDLPLAFSEENIHVICDHDGSNALRDIRSAADNEAAGDFILRWVRHFTADDCCALHVSMAGGRKTMGYYAGYALSLFGRKQDRLSHVLVAEGYESHPEFYYPPPNSQVIHLRDGRPLDSAAAKVELAEIPFLRLRRHLPAVLLNGDHSFRQAIDLAQRAQGEARLSLRPATGEFVANGIRGKLSPKLMAFWLWFIERQRQGLPPLAPPAGEGGDKTYAAEFLLTAEKHHVCLRGNTTEPLEKRGMDHGFFEQTKSRLHKRLASKLGSELATRFRIFEEGQRGRTCYRMADGLQIDINTERNS